MGKHIEEKSLVVINEGSIFYRIKRFFRNLFNGKNEIIQPQVSNINNEVQDNEKETFVESLKNSLKNIEDEETKLLKLQKQYEKGEIATDELSNEQILSLKELYKKQIGNLERSNENRKRKILQHKDGQSFWKGTMNTENDETKLLKLQRQYDSGNIKVDDLSDSQMKDLIKLYKKQISELSKSNETRKQKLLQYRKRLQAT